MCTLNLHSAPVHFIWHSLSPLRHPPGHAYFDPNDFLEGIQQDIEREELEYEVKYEAPPIHLHSPPFNEDLHSDRDALLVHKQTQGRLCVSSPNGRASDRRSRYITVIDGPLSRRTDAEM